MALNSALPRVVILGRANVGKSSLFNRLCGRRQAITDAAAGTTRDANLTKVEWSGYQFSLSDLAGLAAGESEVDQAVQAQIAQQVLAADVLLVVVDAGVAPTLEDLQAARLARRTGRPTMLVLNKIDTCRDPLSTSAEYHSLGLSTLISVSSLHGRGTGDLLDALTKLLPRRATATASNPLHLALLGRPNVGKSSLLNRLSGEDRAIVTAAAGTTRDPVLAELTNHGRRIVITDTAGVRRRGRIMPGVEKFSVLRTTEAIKAADIGILVMDATELGVAGDQHIAGSIADAGKGLILVVNKYDALASTVTADHLAQQLQRDFQFVWWAPLVFVSATTGLHVPQIISLARQIETRRGRTLPTPHLNRLLQSLVAAQPPAGLKGRRPQLKYITQTGTHPPTFTIFGSHPNLIHFSWRRYLENGLREAFDLTGTPITIAFQAKEGPLK